MIKIMTALKVLFHDRSVYETNNSELVSLQSFQKALCDRMSTHLADDWTRFRRFLCMGREPALYSVEDVEPTRRSVSAMKNLIENGEGKEVVQEIKKFCIEGRAAKYKPIIYALAICAKDRDVQDEKIKEEAYKILCDVC